MDATVANIEATTHEMKMSTGETIFTRWAFTKAVAEQRKAEFQAAGYTKIRVFEEPRSPLAPFRIVGWSA